MAASKTTAKKETAESAQPGALTDEEAKKQAEIAKAEEAKAKDASSTGVQKEGAQPPSLENTQEQRLIDGIDRAEKATDGPTGEGETVTSENYVIAKGSDQYHADTVSVRLRGWVGPDALVIPESRWDEFKKLVNSYKP